MKGYRTLTFNVAAMLPLILELAMQIIIDPEFGALIPEEWLTEYGLTVAVINILLRRITTTPMGRSQ